MALNGNTVIHSSRVQECVRQIQRLVSALDAPLQILQSDFKLCHQLLGRLLAEQLLRVVTEWILRKYDRTTWSLSENSVTGH